MKSSLLPSIAFDTPKKVTKLKRHIQWKENYFKRLSSFWFFVQSYFVLFMFRLENLLVSFLKSYLLNI